MPDREDNFAIIAEVEDFAVARVLITALKAHGFHPLEGGESGLPGMPGVTGARGTVAIQVPTGEQADARALAKDLLSEMRD